MNMELKDSENKNSEYYKKLQYAINMHSSLSGYSVDELLELDKNNLLDRDALINHYCKIKD